MVNSLGRRQLAAIMFADISGYTALMQEDERRAVASRVKLKEILEKHIPAYEGSVLQFYGDGSLSIFRSAINSVECAIILQKELQGDPVVPVRIGLHTGDVIIEKEGIFGDGVNIASRIESLGTPGSILLSEKLFDEIKNHKEILTRQLGTYRLKNVKNPIAVYAIANEGVMVPETVERTGKGDLSMKTIAVLPFASFSSDKENEIFCDGITEELINALTRVEGLQVTSRTSSFLYKGKNEDIRSIGKILNVSRILEGSVRKAGNRIRVTAQLINTADGYHIWSESYDRELEDIFELQDELTMKIVHTLREKLDSREETLVVSRTENLEAYHNYLTGMHCWNKFNPDEIKKSIDYFDKAISLDPGFIPAHASRSYSYAALGVNGRINPELAFANARESAEKAIQLDDQTCEPHLAKGLIYLFYDIDMKKARESFLRGLDINPGSSLAKFLYGFYLTHVGRIKDAQKVLEETLRIDPLSLITMGTLANIYRLNGLLKESLKMYKRVLEIDPTYRSAHEGIGWVYYLMNKIEESIRSFKKMSELTGSSLKGITGLTFVLARTGQTGKAELYLKKIHKRASLEKDVSLEQDLLIAYYGFKDIDKAFYYLEKMLQKRLAIFFIHIDPVFKDLREDQRYANLLKKYNVDFSE